MRFFTRRFPGHASFVPFLAPWWGAPNEDKNSLNLGQFAQWEKIGRTHYELVSEPSQADVWMLSIPWKLTRGNPEAKTFADAEIREAVAHGKRIFIFFDSDHDDPIQWPSHAVVLRFSIYADTRNSHEFSIPTFSQDFLAQNFAGRLIPRQKTDRPSVGFCGYAPPLGCRPSKQSARELGRYLAYRLGLLKKRRQLVAHAVRVHAIAVLRGARNVDAKFILRDQFAFNKWGVLQPGGTQESAARQRGEFIGNLNDCDYTLCARGLANCSIRFYEAISLGRLPVFVNTACVLPYDWCVDWKRICIWVEEKDVARIDSILVERHRLTVPEDFIAKQVEARALFERWIAPEGFFSNLHRHLERVG